MRLYERPRKKHRWPLLAGLAMLVVVYTAWALLRPMPALQPAATKSLAQAAAGSRIAWPNARQAAVGIVGYDRIESMNSSTEQLPIASTAKVLTVLTVLDKKPLAKGQQGPTVTLTESDVALYKTETTQDGSSVPVTVGQKITQYQMIQAIMLPSANNMANTLAIWAFGSLDEYRIAANAYLAKHQLTQTTVGDDASGLSPTTKSTARDLVEIGKLAMEHPVLAEIANQSTAAGVPPATTLKNVNSLLGTSNIIGIKTGNTDQAGGVFISASRILINNKPVTIVTAVAGAPDLYSALRGSLALVRSAQTNFTPVTIVKAGTRVGSYNVPWARNQPVVATKNMQLTQWNNTPVRARITLPPSKIPRLTGGSIEIEESAWNNRMVVAVSSTQPVPEPPVWWRLTHPLVF